MADQGQEGRIGSTISRLKAGPFWNRQRIHDALFNVVIPTAALIIVESRPFATMACAGARALSLLKFVGTVSLGLLTGVSYTVSAVSLPSLLSLPSSASASHAVASLTKGLKTHLTVLTALASGPLLVSFILSPRSARHPYLIYTSLLAGLSMAAPHLLLQFSPRLSAAKKQPRRTKMEASYEVLGEAQSESTSEGEIDDVNGEEVRTRVESLTRAFMVRTSLAALGFAMSVLGIWGDGAPQTLVYVS